MNVDVNNKSVGLQKMFIPEVSGGMVPTRVSMVKDEEEDYCYPYLVELSVKKTVGLSSKHICAFDGNGTLLVQVIGGFWQFKKKRTMYNSFGVPILTMRKKVHTFIFSTYKLHFLSRHYIWS